MSAISSTGKSQTKDIVGLWIAIVLFVAGPAWMFLDGLWECQLQRRVIQTYAPVEATVLTSVLSKHVQSKGPTHYVPEIAYEYQVNDKTYRSHRYRAVDVWGNEDWANSVVDKYRPKQTCRAYYNAAKPEEAVLSKVYSFSPYFQSLEGVFCLAIGVFLTLNVWAERKRGPSRSENGWYQVFSKFTNRTRLQVAFLCSALWYGLGAVVAGHYFYCVTPPYPNRNLHFFEGFAAFGLIPVMYTVRYFRILRHLRDAQLVLNQALPVPGQEFKFAISQQAQRPLTLDVVQANLRCLGVKTNGRSRRRTVLHEEHAVDLKNHTLHLGENLELSGAVTIKPDLPPSGRDASGKFDWIEWEMILRCTAKGTPDYQATFPLTVGPVPVAEPRPTANLPLRSQVEIQKINSPLAGRFLAKRNIALGYLVGLTSVWLMSAGMAMMVVAYPVVFHDPTFHSPIAVSPARALPIFSLGAAMVVGAILQTFVFRRPDNLLLRWRMSRAIGHRQDAIVSPQAEDSLFVDVIPRTNWNRLMLENAADIGFLTVDAGRREIRFEGDRERYRIPADGIQSCTLEKSLISKSATASAPGAWLVVVRAQRGDRIWEAPFAIRVTKGSSQRKTPAKSTKDLHERICSLLPESVETIPNAERESCS